jgi:hypothetical protein
MQRGSLKDVGTELFPIVRLREDGAPKSPRAITALFRLANLENQLQFIRIPEIAGHFALVFNSCFVDRFSFRVREGVASRSSSTPRA